jgi:DNA-directed RNA polymerase specialized sigma24 family protein
MPDQEAPDRAYFRTLTDVELRDWIVAERPEYGIAFEVLFTNPERYRKVITRAAKRYAPATDPDEVLSEFCRIMHEPVGKPSKTVEFRVAASTPAPQQFRITGNNFSSVPTPDLVPIIGRIEVLKATAGQLAFGGGHGPTPMVRIWNPDLEIYHELKGKLVNVEDATCLTVTVALEKGIWKVKVVNPGLAWERLRKWDPERGAFAPWLFFQIRNLCQKLRLRDERGNFKVALPPDGGNDGLPYEAAPPPDGGNNELLNAAASRMHPLFLSVARTLKTLMAEAEESQERRAARMIYDHYLRGLTDAEIAPLVYLNRETVCRQRREGLKAFDPQLRASMAASLGTPEDNLQASFEQLLGMSIAEVYQRLKWQMTADRGVVEHILLIQGIVWKTAFLPYLQDLKASLPTPLPGNLPAYLAHQDWGDAHPSPSDVALLLELAAALTPSSPL